MKKNIIFLALILYNPIILNADDKSGYIDKTHRLLSDWIYDTSNKIDTFFSRKDMEFHTKNRSYFNLSFDMYTQEHAKSAYKFNAKLRIKLPKTQKSLHLVLEDFKNNISADQQTSSSIANTVADNSYILGIELDKKDTKFAKVKFGSGVHFSGIAPDGYISLYLSKTFYQRGNWEVEINNNAKYFIRKHFDNTMQFLVYKVINENYKFTFLNDYHYKEEGNCLNETLNALILDKYISPKEGISSSFSLYSSKDNTNNFKLHYYLVQTSYKRFFYHNFAYYEFSPGVIFRDSYDFKPKLRAVLKIGVYFSKFSLSGYNKFNTQKH